MSSNTGRSSGTTGTTGSLRVSGTASRSQCTAEHVEITNAIRFNSSPFLLSKLSGPFSSYVEDQLIAAHNLHKCKTKKGPKCDFSPLKNFIGSALIIIGRARAKVKNRDSKFDGIGGLPKGVPVVNWFGERFSVVRLKLVFLNICSLKLQSLTLHVFCAKHI